MTRRQAAPIKLSEHCDIYRGFSIVRLLIRYRVSQGEQSYGLFDTPQQAISYIEQLYKMKGAA